MRRIQQPRMPFTRSEGVVYPLEIAIHPPLRVIHQPLRASLFAPLRVFCQPLRASPIIPEDEASAAPQAIHLEGFSSAQEGNPCTPEGDPQAPEGIAVRTDP